MKNLVLAGKKILGVIAVMAVIGLLSCNNNNKQREEPKDGVRIEIPTPDGPQDFTVYTYEQKDEAVRKANDELDKLNKRIDELKADAKDKSAELSDEAKADYEKAIADLEKTRDAYKDDVDKLQNSTEENWEQVRKDIGSTYDKVKEKVERGWENLKEGVNQTVEEAEKSIQ